MPSGACPLYVFFCWLFLYKTTTQMVQISAAELLVHRDNILEVPDCVITPGLVDMHVHIIGGGGEAGPSSCTPQSQLSNFLEAGITTVVGVLGTDCITRRQVHLLPFATGDVAVLAWQASKEHLLMIKPQDGLKSSLLVSQCLS